MSDTPQMPRDQNNESMQVSYYDTLRAQTLDGSSSAAASTVLSETGVVVVRLVPQDFGEAWFKRGENPTAAEDDGVYFNGEITTVVDVDEKISVYGAKVNLSILRKQQS